MSGRIPESFIESLMGRVDIVEVIERRVPLKRAGKEYQACCPFHNEKTPSFTVSPKKQFYHCFGCGAHGTAVGFLMQYEGLEFVDAIEELAKHVGMEVPREAGHQRSKPTVGLYETLEKSARYYQDQLRQHPAAVEYLKKRGLSGEIARDFGIGYAPSGWDSLLNHIGGGEESKKLLSRAGMLSQGDRGVYDKFRERIMFPIHDRRGRVIAFGGRALEDKGPKYLNSPETELFHKGRELYGLYLARQRTGRLDRLLVVEGYMDVVALAQFGIRNSVATLGTATTGEHAELLFRNADEVIYCFDGDNAGRKAAWRALESTLPKLRDGRQARFLFLPDGEDPDSLVRKEGQEAFEARLDTAQPLSEFFFDHFRQQVDMNSLDGRSRFVALAKPHLEHLPEGVFRDMMEEQMSQISGYSMKLAKPVQETVKNRSDGPARTPMRLALGLLVQNPEFAKNINELEELVEADQPGVDILRELVDFCRSHPNMSTAQLLELWYEHPAQSHLKKLAIWEMPGDEQQQAAEFQDALTSIKLQWVEARLAEMPRIVDLEEDQRSEYLALQQRRQGLRDKLQGNDS